VRISSITEMVLEVLRQLGNSFNIAHGVTSFDAIDESPASCTGSAVSSQ
jgi:hypothetical protein